MQRAPERPLGLLNRALPEPSTRQEAHSGRRVRVRSVAGTISCAALGTLDRTLSHEVHATALPGRAGQHLIR